jgi:predicted Holliday junction resolvase-like endonuclease
MIGVLIISAVAAVLISMLAYQLIRAKVDLGTYKATHPKSDKEQADEIGKARCDAAQRSRSVLRGQDLQVFAPWLPKFPGKPNEARPVSAEIDYIAFQRDDSNRIDHI